MSNQKLQDLTIKNNFMFAAVMMVPENCKRFLEIALEIEIAEIHIDKEKCLIYHPDFHGIRMDVYAADEQRTHYNIEMQAKACSDLKRRARYYGSQMDMELLEKGIDYDSLPNSYVIFVCDYDPFGERKYVYTQKKVCEESPTVDMDDGSYALFLSTEGTNREEVPDELVEFLDFAGKPLEESEKKTASAFVNQLQETVRRIKADREMGAKYMTFQQFIKDERKEAMELGRAEGRAEGETAKLVALIRKKLEKGQSVDQIAEDLVEELETIRKVIEEYALK